MTGPLTFAVPKGRILDEALPLMARAGVVPEAGFTTRLARLAFGDQPQTSLIRVRAFDVATFVAHGAAQAGIVGSDVIDEFEYSDLYAPVDLGIGYCRLSVAEPAGAATSADARPGRDQVSQLTRRHFEARGVQAECVKLNGAMEIAPARAGRADRRSVSSGQTLKDNGLVETNDHGGPGAADRQPRRAQDALHECRAGRAVPGDRAGSA